MRIPIFIIIFVVASCSNFNKETREVEIQAIGWDFDLSTDLCLQDSAFNNKGELFGDIYYDSLPLRIFNISEAGKGWLSAYILKDSLDTDKWLKNVDSKMQEYYERLAISPKTEFINGEYSFQEFNKMRFQVIYARFVNANSDTSHGYAYYGKLKGITLRIDMVYQDEETGEKFKNIVRSSKFSK